MCALSQPQVLLLSSSCALFAVSCAVDCVRGLFSVIASFVVVVVVFVIIIEAGFCTAAAALASARSPVWFGGVCGGGAGVVVGSAVDFLGVLSASCFLGVVVPIAWKATNAV